MFGYNWPMIFSPGTGSQLRSPFAKHRLESVRVHPSQIADLLDAKVRQTLCRFWADPPQPLHG